MDMHAFFCGRALSKQLMQSITAARLSSMRTFFDRSSLGRVSMSQGLPSVLLFRAEVDFPSCSDSEEWTTPKGEGEDLGSAPAMKAPEIHFAGHSESSIFTLSESAWTNIESRPDEAGSGPGRVRLEAARPGGADDLGEIEMTPDEAASSGGVWVESGGVTPGREHELEMLRLCEGALGDLEEVILRNRHWRCAAIQVRV